MDQMAESQATENEEASALNEQADIGTEGDVPSGEANDNAKNEQVLDEADDVVVTIGEEAPPHEEHAQAPEWVRELRKNQRELQRRNRELEEQLKTKAMTETKPVALGTKPALIDYDFDSEQYEIALENWYLQKGKVEEQELKAKADEKAQHDAWQTKLNAYSEAKTKLKVKDFEDAEDIAQEMFSPTQQGIILQGAENPALLIYALGKNPAKAKEIASIHDPVKYAFAIAKLETQLKVSQRKAPPPESTIIHGNGSISSSVDSTLERLRADAAKTGDYTKVVQYRQSKRSVSK